MKVRAVFLVGALVVLCACSGTLERPSPLQASASHQVPLSDEIKANLGTIGVIPAATDSILDIRRPSGTGKSGTGGGPRKPNRGLALLFAAVAAPHLVLINAVGTAVSAPRRAAEAKAKTAREAVIRELEAKDTEFLPILRRVVDDEAIGRKLAKRVHALALSTTLLDPDRLPGVLENTALLSRHGIDTVLQLRAKELSLVPSKGFSQGSPNTVGFDCVCGLRLLLTARLVRVADGSVLDERTFHYVTTSHEVRVVDWAADDAAMLRRVLPLVYTRLAEQVIDVYVRSG